MIGRCSAPHALPELPDRPANSLRAAANPDLQNSRRREQRACHLCPKAAHTLLSQFPGIFRRDSCCSLLRVADRRGSPIPLLLQLRLRLVFGHSRKSSKSRSPSLYAQGAEIRTARRADEDVSSWDTHSSHRFCEVVAHLLVASAEAPAGKGVLGRLPSSAQRTSAYGALGWHRCTR